MHGNFVSSALLSLFLIEYDHEAVLPSPVHFRGKPQFAFY